MSATAAAVVRAAKGWPACTAGCGWPLDPAATTDGHTTHPSCRPLRVIQGGKA